LRVTAQNTSPRVAYQLVNSLIQNYLQWKINAARTDSLAAQKFFANLIVDYQRDLDQAYQALKDYVRTHPEPIRGERPILEELEITRLQSDISLAETRYTNALNKEEDANLSLQQIETNIEQTYVLVDAPVPPRIPEVSQKDIAISLAVFLVVGSIITGGLVVVSTVFDRTIRFPDEVINQFDLPVLGMIPKLKTQRRRKWLRNPFRKKIPSVDSKIIGNELTEVNAALIVSELDKEADGVA
jgi:hypothetical protein